MLLAVNIYTIYLYSHHHYVNVSVLIKFSQKTSVFTLIIISSPYKNHMFWMCIRIASVRRFKYTSTTYDFMKKYQNFSLFIILISTPDFPHFYYMLGGNLGSLLYGDVSVMTLCTRSHNISKAHKKSSYFTKKGKKLPLKQPTLLVMF